MALYRFMNEMPGDAIVSIVDDSAIIGGEFTAGLLLDEVETVIEPHSADQRASKRPEAVQTVGDGGTLFDDAASTSADSEYAATAREQSTEPSATASPSFVTSTSKLSMSQRSLRRRREGESTDDQQISDVGSECAASTSEPSLPRLQRDLQRHKQGESATKCRPQEANYSQELRKTLYEKEEVLNDFRRYLRNLKVTYNEEMRALREKNEQLQQMADASIGDHKSKMLELQEMQKREQAYIEERDGLQAHINNEQAMLASQYTLEVDKLHKEMKAEFDARIQEVRQACTTNGENQIQALERKNQELHEQLDRAQAEKETELANLGQRYARQAQKTTPRFASKEVDVDELDVDEADRARPPTARFKSPHTGFRFASVLESGADEADRTCPPTAHPKSSHTTFPKHRPAHSPRQPSVVTPNLDAIKRMKKARGISRRSCLVGIQLPDDQSTTSHESTVEPQTISTPRADAPITQIPEIVDAITKGVQTALQSMFGSNIQAGQFSPHLRRSPRRKRAANQELEQEKREEPRTERDFYLREARRVFKKKFGFDKDIDFITAQSAPPEDVKDYQYEDGPGPDLENPLFDLRHNVKSLWNQAVVDILLKEVKENSVQEEWPTQRSDPYIRELIAERYKRLRTIWRDAQPKVTGKGTLETPAETEGRIALRREEVMKEARQTTRRRSKYARRTTILNHIGKIKAEGNEDDLEAWQWLQDLVSCLGEHGMSSEESGIENEVEEVLRVKRMTWRRPIERELELIDLQRLMDIDVFLPQGSRPMRRLRAQTNPISSRGAPKGLSKALYDRTWLAGLTTRERGALDISGKVFPWMTIAIA